MIQNIVIEGPNNVGKSTLINKLLNCERFKLWKTEHITERSPNTMEFYDATLRNCRNTIFDRHCIGETIYPLLFNRTNNITPNQMLDLVKEHANTLFVIISADLNFINMAYDKKREIPNWYFITEERQMFEDAADMLLEQCPNVIFHMNQSECERMEELVTYIIDACEEH